MIVVSSTVNVTSAKKRVPYPSLQVNSKPVWNKYPLRPPFDFFIVIALLQIFNLGSLYNHADHGNSWYSQYTTY